MVIVREEIWENLYYIYWNERIYINILNVYLVKFEIQSVHIKEEKGSIISQCILNNISSENILLKVRKRKREKNKN